MRGWCFEQKREGDDPIGHRCDSLSYLFMLRLCNIDVKSVFLLLYSGRILIHLFLVSSLLTEGYTLSVSTFS